MLLRERIDNLIKEKVTMVKLTSTISLSLDLASGNSNHGRELANITDTQVTAHKNFQKASFHCFCTSIRRESVTHKGTMGHVNPRYPNQDPEP